MKFTPVRLVEEGMADPLSGSICYELRRASVPVMAAMSAEFGQWNLKTSEAYLLRFIAANQGCTQSAVARALGSKPANLVPLIARLERDGLLERMPGEGRAVALSITDRGMTMLGNIEAGFQRLEGRLGAGLTADQKQAMIDALRTICRAACHYDSREP